jgi:hypothetical protein
MLNRGHIATEDLLDYAENLAGASLRARVRAHLESGCEQCTEELQTWTRVVATLQADRAFTPPETARQQAFALFERLERLPSLPERILAALVFDSRRQFLSAGSRQEGSVSFELLFEAGGITIDLLCERERDQWQIAGQVHSEEAAPNEWKVVSAGPGEQRETEMDASNEFRLSGIAPGAYTLTLLNRDQEIVLPDIVLSFPDSA